MFLVPKAKDINIHVNIKRSKAYYVELKGIALHKAYEQLYNAIDRTKNELSGFDIEAVVVSVKGRQPKIENCTAFKKVKQLIKKDILIYKVHRGNNFTHVEKI